MEAIGQPNKMDFCHTYDHRVRIAGAWHFLFEIYSLDTATACFSDWTLGPTMAGWSCYHERAL